MNEFFFVIQAQKIERNFISKHVVYKGFQIDLYLKMVYFSFYQNI